MATMVTYPTHVDTWTEGPPGKTYTVSQFRLWTKTDSGKTYRRYVDVTWGSDFGATQPPDGGWPPSVVDVLYRAQKELANNPDIFGPPISSSDSMDDQQNDSQNPAPSIVNGFNDRDNNAAAQDIVDGVNQLNLPSDPNNPCREHDGGKLCWCGRTHPPHRAYQFDCATAPFCWCRKKHCGAGLDCR